MNNKRKSIKLCGAVFINEKHFLVFHCTQCEDVMNSFKEFQTHLIQHFSEVKKDINVKNTLPEDNLKDEVYLERSNSSLDSVELVMDENTENNPTKDDYMDEKIDFTAEQVFPRKRYRTTYVGAVRKHKCHLCGFAFKDSYNLNSHIRRHKGLKNHDCTVCSKKFSTRKELEVHQRRHTGEQPFLCTICGKTYFTSSGLIAHMKRHENKRPYKCEICDKSFFDQKGLQDHKVSHSDERNVLCPQCPVKFKSKKTLHVHMKIHLNKKEYRCHLCEASFNQRSGLMSHLKARHRRGEFTNAHSLVVQ